MTTTLFQAVNASGETANGAVTNVSSLNKNVDLFFLGGASRGKDIANVFAGALVEDPEVAVRVLQWARDVRGGAGERQTFRDLFLYLIISDEPLAERLMAKIPEIGRWDDILIAFGSNLERKALRMIAAALTAGNGLCAKWMPRQGKEAGKIRSYMKLQPKDYRRLLVPMSKTVEQKMCARKWNDIKYEHVPSVAAARYQKAFGKHDPVGYGSYKEKLTKGETTINAGAVYPYDVLRSLKAGDKVVANAQWTALPNYLEGSNESILPIVDVSGSMCQPVAGSKVIQAIDVAISLGLYLSERNNGIFKDQFVTFSGSPQLVELKGDLNQRYTQMSHADWAMNTDIQKVFKLLLKSAVTHKVDQSQMPTKLLILSDMEFDSCVTMNSTSAGRFASGSTINVSAMEMIEAEYSAAGYKVPGIIFWNLAGRSGNSPVTYNKVGAALVSGFSPSIVKSVLGGDDLSPIGIMLKTVMIDRYDF